MDRRRALSPVYTRQYSTNTNSSDSSSTSPAASPAHPHHARTGSLGGGYSTIKRTQNVAQKAAARRLAQVMASQTSTNSGSTNGPGGGGDGDYDYEDGDDDDYNNGLIGGGPDLGLGLRFVPPPRRPNNNNNGNGVNTNGLLRPAQRAPSPALGRNYVDLTASVRSTSAGRATSVRQTTVAPATKTSNLRTPAAIPQIDVPTSKARDNRRFTDLSPLNLKDTGSEPEESALRDELEMLQEENEIVLEKFRQAEKKREEAEARARELEKQVASLGEGISLEAKLISRKEAALRQRELALKAAKESREGKDEIANFRTELKNLREEAAVTLDKLQEAESEAKSLRTMTQRMILTQEEKEEVVLKRCWLARYWGLAVHHGISADIAGSKYELWSAFAPLPFEVVISAGQKAKEDFLNKRENNSDRWNKSGRDPSDLTGEGNVESMLSVEMGLREMASLKIEDAVVLSMAQRRRPNLVRDPKMAGDPKFLESFELGQEESDDVLFKEAWLTYFWKRARDHRVEEDIAEERLQFWTSRSGQSPSLQDAVDVERGFIELRKLGIEQQLWEASRKEIGNASLSESTNHKNAVESENSS